MRKIENCRTRRTDRTWNVQRYTLRRLLDSHTVLAMVLLAIGGCHDPESLMTAPLPNGNLGVTQALSPLDSGGLIIAPRFQISATTSGALRPGQPVTIHITVIPLVVTAHAAISVVLPEVATASRHN
jgi:energy-converting hydrogenase Eha subunit F